MDAFLGVKGSPTSSDLLTALRG